MTKDITKDGVVNVDDLSWDYLEGDGDFRSKEVRRLRDEADIIITNPPFSLFREFLSWIVEADKSFLIIGNMNAITYKDVFPLIMDNKIWLGATNFNKGMYFYVTEDFVYANTYKFERVRNGKKVNRVPGVCWFTNLDHGRRHQPLPLMTMADNLKFSKHKDIVGKSAYDRYDNYDAIEVPYTDAIPSDYDGVMGVQLVFSTSTVQSSLRLSEAMPMMVHLQQKKYGNKFKVVNGKRMKSQTGTMGGCVIREKNSGSGTYFDVGYPVRAVYKRIFIKHKR